MPQYVGSSTPINAGQTYTSKWVNTNQWGNISGSVFADQAGTLFIEQSGDGVNADVSTSVTFTASTGSSYVQQLLLPYVRLRVTNTAGSNQTVLRLFSRFILGEGT